jgi:hypothetical protein
MGGDGYDYHFIDLETEAQKYAGDLPKALQQGNGEVSLGLPYLEVSSCFMRRTPSWYLHS